MGPQPKLRVAKPDSTARAVRKGSRPVYFPDAGRFLDCPVYDRFAMSPGKRLRGPAVIEELESTVVIGPGTIAEIDDSGNVVATLPRAARRERAAS
jgi:N-methylhydantoinase A/oxoprolinase/acetone carboxylase beta subunit